MITLGILGQIYLVSMIVGGGFIAINLFMGNIADNADDGGAGGGDDFAGGGDDGSAGNDFGGGDGGDGGGADAGGDDLGGGGNSGMKLLSPGIARANLIGSGHHHHGGSRSKHFGTVVPTLPARIGNFLLGLLSPMSIAMFLTFFGVFGLLFDHLTPWLGYFSLVPAILISTAISNVFKYIVRYLMVHGNVSTEAKAEDSIGQVGEIITPIKEGRAGEVTYVVGSKRYHATAKPHKEGIEFKRGSKVLITGIKDHVVYVDECNLLELQ